MWYNYNIPSTNDSRFDMNTHIMNINSHSQIYNLNLRRAEWPILHVYPAPRSPSECRSDDVVNRRAWRRLVHSPLTSPRGEKRERACLPHSSLFVARCLDTQLLRIKNIHGLFNYSYLTLFWQTGIVVHTFCALLCDIFGTNLILYYLQSSLVRIYNTIVLSLKP